MGSIISTLGIVGELQNKARFITVEDLDNGYPVFESNEILDQEDLKLNENVNMAWELIWSIAVPS